MRPSTVPSLILALSAIFVLAVGLPSAPALGLTTNAQRFARNLPPLPPKRLYEASAVRTATKAKRSASATAFTCSGEQPYAVCCGSTAIDGLDSSCLGAADYGNTATNMNDCSQPPASTFPAPNAYCCAGYSYFTGDGCSPPTMYG